MNTLLKIIDFPLIKQLNDLNTMNALATWRNGYAKDCKYLTPTDYFLINSIIK